MKTIRYIMYGVILSLGGCAGYNGKQNLATQSAYNHNLIKNTNEELLMNIVRIRYEEHPSFLEIANLKEASSFNTGMAFGFNKTIMSAAEKAGYPGAFNVGLTPSISNGSDVNYTRLSGENYVKKLKVPIHFSIVTSLIQSGWPLEEVVNLCIERVNDLYNADTADGPMPEQAPEYENFYYFSHLLDELHKQHLVYFNKKPNTNFSNLHMHIKEKSGYRSKVYELKRLAGLDPDESLFEIDDNFLDQAPDKLVVQCRSLSGVLHFLSKGVDVPQVDIEEKVAGVTKNHSGQVFDWSSVCNKFRVSWSVDRPKDAYVACEYRGAWFYIADNDLESKRTFSLLLELMVLQSGKYKSTEPLLVIGG